MTPSADFDAFIFNLLDIAKAFQGGRSLASAKGRSN